MASYVNGARLSDCHMSPLLCCINDLGNKSYKIMRRLLDAGANATFSFNALDENRVFMYETTPLQCVATIIRDKTIGVGGAKLTENQLEWAKMQQKLLLQADAIHALSWIWVHMVSYTVADKERLSAMPTRKQPAIMAPMWKHGGAKKRVVTIRALIR